jgi:tRNA nucleotidyltransferase (CCA-adding enzyme)
LHELSFLDDPTRMFRAARYEQRLGFKIDARTIELIPEARSLIDQLSAQRIRHELDLILDEPKSSSILGRLAELDLLTPIHPALAWDKSINKRFQAAQLTDIPSALPLEPVEVKNDTRLLGWLLWLLGLTDKQIVSLNNRLHFTAPYLESLLAASRLFINLGRLLEWKASKCVEYLDEMPFIAIQAVYLATPDENLKLPLEKYINEWRHVKPKTSGIELKRLGLRPGPDYRTILRELRNAWLDQEILDELGEKRRLKETLRRHQNLQG